jgi:hypothetical protein
MPPGGKRAGAGRKPKIHKDAEVDQSPGFATTVLGRISEGKPAVIKDAYDYQLDLLFQADMQTRSVNFNRLLDRKYGKPAQGTFQGDTRELQRPLERGDLPSHFEASRKSAGTHKPN